MHQIRFRPELGPGSRWGSSRRSPRPLVGCEISIQKFSSLPLPSPSAPTAPRFSCLRLRRSPQRLRCLASSVPPLLFSQFKHWLTLSVTLQTQGRLKTRQSKTARVVDGGESNSNSFTELHCALAAVQCIVIGPVCGFVGGWVC